MADPWHSISAADYARAFARFGGSFATHPRVVAFLGDLAGRPVSYAGLARDGEVIAAVPHWQDHVLATKPALHHFGAPWLVDIGDSEILLPIMPGARITLPFRAFMLSALHAGTIAKLDREEMDLTLAKGLAHGAHRQSGRSQTRRRLEERAFLRAGGRFVAMADLSAADQAAIYGELYGLRWNGLPLGHAHLVAAFETFRDFLCGDVLFHGDRPVAFELTYAHENPDHLFVNSVQAGHAIGLFPQHSLGSILYFHNLGLLEARAAAGGKALRYNLGRNDAPYKTMLAYPQPAYQVAAGGSDG